MSQKKKPILKDVYTTSFKNSVASLRRFKFHDRKIAHLCGLSQRSFYRIMSGDRIATFEECLQAQCSVIAILEVHSQILRGEVSKDTLLNAGGRFN